MKREEILLYMQNDVTRVYLVNSSKENIINVDTSLFFKFGEISNVALCEKFLTEVLVKVNSGLFYLRPNITILYNDVSYSDIKYLYKSSIKELNFNLVYFVPLSKLVKTYIKKRGVVVFDKNYYTDIDRGCKLKSISGIEFEPILIGGRDNAHTHYSDKDIIWKTFKTYFTNLRSCDKIDVGDD